MNVAAPATMLRLELTQRTALSETLRELANVVAGILVLGQFIGEQSPSWQLIIGRVIGWLILSALGLVLLGGRSNEPDS